MSRLTIYIPDLFAAADAGDGSLVAEDATKSLTRLLSRSHRRDIHDTCPESTIARLCGFTESDYNGAAQLTRLIDQPALDSENILRADPVHLRADPHQILLFGAPQVLPTFDEADALIEELNRALEPMRFVRGAHAARWYVDAAALGEAQCSTLSSVNGRSIGAMMPQGGGAKAYERLMHEAQMILHASDVNQDRESRGLPVINSVWLWGGGNVKRPAEPAIDFIVAEDLFSCAVAKFLQLPLRTPESLDAIFPMFRSKKEHALVVLGHPTGGPPMQTSDALDQFGPEWPTWLLKALQSRELGCCQVVTDRHVYELNVWRAWKWWRKSKSMRELSL